MSVFVSCGEPSGDVYAGGLIRALISRGEKIFGMLGKNGIEAGGEAVWGYEALHLMGIVEVLPSIPRLFRLRNEIAREIIARAPSSVVVIDSPDFHLPLIKKIRKIGYSGKIIYLATPTVWAWRSGRARVLRDFCDLCLPLFSFEHEWLVKHGINSAWKCHPLAGGVPPFGEPPFEGKDERVIAFMPGSRSYDIRWHLDALLESAHKVSSLGYHPIFSIAPGLHGELRDRLISRIKENNFEMCECEGRELLARCVAAVGVSGTISVEAMLLKRFMVVVYNGNLLSWLVWKLFIHTPYISMPNLIAPEPIFPELLSRRMTSDNIVAELIAYLESGARREKFAALAAAAVSSMGKGAAAEFWANEIENIAFHETA